VGWASTVAGGIEMHYDEVTELRNHWVRHGADHCRNGGPAGGHHRPANEVPLVREAATALLASVDEIAHGMTALLHRRIPELADTRGGPLLEETRASCRANVGQIVRALARGEAADTLVTPPEAIEYARSYVRRELPLAVLLRCYRLGQAYFLERWTTALSIAEGSERGFGEAVLASTAWVSAYVDHVCNELEVEYRTARERWARTPDAIRAETTRRILDGTLGDEREAGRLLGHELGHRHHLSVVIWESGEGRNGTARGLEHAASAVADTLGMREPLVMLPGGSELWAWFSALDKPEQDPTTALAELQQPPGVRLAAGRIHVGMEGFRSSHIEARAAARVAVLALENAPSITLYDDVELLSLLSADLDRARAFVSYELGGLAGADRGIARLRETMLVLLEEGMSNSRAAHRLYVHHNTVVYRTARAQELLGHRLADRRIQVTAALMLAQTLGDVVLREAPG
jgi:PucR C-terminal helix-turn-helix domain/GGDEF-like domain